MNFICQEPKSKVCTSIQLNVSLHFESWWFIHLQPRKPFEFMNLLKFVFSILAPFQTYLYSILYLYRYKHFFALAVVVIVVRIFHLRSSLPSLRMNRIVSSNPQKNKTRQDKAKNLLDQEQAETTKVEN